MSDAKKPEPEKPLVAERPPGPEKTPVPEKPPVAEKPKEIGGPKGPEPTRYGDWERNGRCSDF